MPRSLPARLREKKPIQLKNRLRQENKHITKNLTDKKILFLPSRFCPLGQFENLTRIAHICKSHKPTLRPNLQKSAILPTLMTLLKVSLLCSRMLIIFSNFIKNQNLLTKPVTFRYHKVPKSDVKLKK
jgi:hypothetical protein